MILGRGAAVVLGKDLGFHVRLDGPPALRAVQGAAIERIEIDEARRYMDAADRARVAYVRRLYRADPADPRHYHLVIDSTAIPLDTVTEVILRSLSSFPAALFAPVATPPLLLCSADFDRPAYSQGKAEMIREILREVRR